MTSDNGPEGRQEQDVSQTSIPDAPSELPATPAPVNTSPTEGEIAELKKVLGDEAEVTATGDETPVANGAAKGDGAKKARGQKGKKAEGKKAEGKKAKGKKAKGKKAKGKKAKK